MNLKLKQYREAENLTQKQFAKLIGKSIGTIQSWERGDSFPNAEAIWNMCLHFNTDPNTFLGWYDAHPREDAAGLSSDEAEVIGSYRECTPEWKRHVAMTALAAKGESLKSAEPAARVDAEGLSEAM